MRIHLVGNHVGYTRARELQELLGAGEHEIVWHGPPDFDANDDYPVLCVRLAQAVVADEDEGVTSRGIVVSGDASGETVATNKVNGARAVPAIHPDFVRAARIHADANVLILPIDFLNGDDIPAMVTVFLDQAFSCTLDDARRLVNTAEYETSGTIEGWMVDR